VSYDFDGPLYHPYEYKLLCLIAKKAKGCYKLFYSGVRVMTEVANDPSSRKFSKSDCSRLAMTSYLKLNGAPIHSCSDYD
jgi:hypothetical protein